MMCCAECWVCLYTLERSSTSARWDVFKIEVLTVRGCDAQRQALGRPTVQQGPRVISATPINRDFDNEPAEIINTITAFGRSFGIESPFSPSINGSSHLNST